MSRKRKSDESTSTEIPTATLEPPAANTAAAVAEPPMAQPVPEAGFADKVGQNKREPLADPFGIATDNVAGVRLFESRQDRQVAIKFGDGSAEQKPSQAVIDRMKEAGYRWNPRDRIWAHPVQGASAMSTRIEAEKLYQEVRQMIREDKGIEASPGVPF
jgi:hypothetical protein